FFRPGSNVLADSGALDPCAARELALCAPHSRGKYARRDARLGRHGTGLVAAVASRARLPVRARPGDSHHHRDVLRRLCRRRRTDHVVAPYGVVTMERLALMIDLE